MIVRTVLGDIEPGALGATYMHEHLIIDSPLVEDRMPEIHLPSVDEACAEVERCRSAGLDAVVDAIPAAAGRDVVRLAEISAATGLHIVATTGLHTSRWYPGRRWAMDAPVSVLAGLFIADIEEGVDRYDYTGPIIDRTEHQAGIIKVATMGDITDRDRRLFAAAAEAHRRTGAPILTHCEAGVGGVEQVEIFGELGVGLDRVMLSHTDKVLDAAYHRDLLASGVNLVYDQALRQPPEEEEGTAWLIAEMIDAGHADQLMLGTDGARRSMWSTLGGAPGLDWLLTGFSIALEDRGIDIMMRNRLFVTNPARFLSFEGIQ